MIETLDFDGWFKTYKPEETVYYAIYDPETFKVVGVYPKGPAESKEYKIKIETVIAEEIINGSLNLSFLTVDIETENLIISENQISVKTDSNFYKLESNMVDLISISLSIKYIKEEKKLYFNASENLLKQKDKFKDHILPCLFYITDYNDPNILYETVKLNLDELFSKQEVKFTLDIGKEKFSIFTKKIFNSYYFVIK
jgi:hypothetical protein